MRNIYHLLGSYYSGLAPSISPFGRELRRREKVRLFPAPRCAASSRAIEGIFHSDLTDVKTPQERRLLRGFGAVDLSLRSRASSAGKGSSLSRSALRRLLARNRRNFPFRSYGHHAKRRPKKVAFLRGAVDRNRTDTGSPPTDFESVASASFTTTACHGKNYSIVRWKNQAFFLRFLQKHGRRGTM